jgi:hypothetical protein
MPIELESDRLGLGADKTCALTGSGNTINVPCSAVPSESMDASETDVDEWIEALVTDEQMTEAALGQGDGVTLDGQGYYIAKIEPDDRHAYGGGGLNVLYLHQL